MKKLLAVVLMMGSASLFAVQLTDMNSNWICTTNASKSEVKAEQNADEAMDKTKGAAKHSFNFAADNCRDCTKITCVAKN